MRNENLFEKIKETALTETAGTDEYDPEKIWSDIQKKSKKTRILWWPYAAASVVLAVLVLLNLPEKQQHVVVRIKNPGPAAVSEKPLGQTERKTDNLPVTHKSPDSDTNVDRSKTIEPELAATAPATASTDTSITDHQFPNSGIAESQPIVSEDQIMNQSKETQSPEQISEKVLVAHIELPEEQSNPQSGLQRIFDQVKKDREARKMRLQFNRNVGKLNLWSFVHRSFVENPPLIQKPEKLNH